MTRERIVLLAGLAAAAVVIAALFLRRPAPMTPVPPAKGPVVLLLTPGASLSDWQNREIAPTLSALTQTMPLAVMPTRAGGNGTLADACRAIAFGTRSPSPDARNLGDILRESKIRAASLGDAACLQPLTGGELVGTAGPAVHVTAPEAPGGVATSPEGMAHSVLHAVRPLEQPSLAAALFDDLHRADEYAPLALPRATVSHRRDALRRLDRLIALLTAPDGLPDDAVLLVAGPLPSAEAARRGERLGPVLLWRRGGGRGVGAGTLLTSPSTRQTPGLMAITDVASTLAALLGVPPSQQRIGAGRAGGIMPAPSEKGAAEYLRGRIATWAAQASQQRLLIFVPWLLAAALLVGAWLRFSSSERARRWAGGIVVGASAVPVALLLSAVLIPNQWPSWTVYLLAAPLCALTGLTAARLSPAATLAGVCGTTALALISDTALGGPLLSRSPLSYSVIEAARFYGIGNETAGVLLGASLLFAGGSTRAGTLLLWGGAVALTLALPGLGADAGGLIAAAVGFGTLLALSRRETESRQKRHAAAGYVIAAAVAAGLLLLGGLALWEGSRGAASRTHIGEAVASARERGAGAVWEIARRKAGVNARLLVTSPWAVLLLAEGITAAWLLKRKRAVTDPERAGEGNDLRPFYAAASASAAAFLVNDSGVVAAATCLLPAVAYLTCRSESGSGDREAPAQGVSRSPAS